MSSDPTYPADQALDDIIGAYIVQTDEGQCPDREQIIKDHPRWTEELRAFFDQHDAMKRIARPTECNATVLKPDLGSSERVGRPSGSFPVEALNNYEILEEIARGGMGIVFKARQHAPERIVALKMLLGGSLASEEDRQRFRAESNAVARLDHPNIVPIYEVSEHEGRPFFTMRLIEGGSLSLPAERTGVTRDGQIRAARILAQVARAVQYAHDRGVLHRDLKPGNILIHVSSDGNEVPYVTDFGLAKQLHMSSDLTRSGAIVGTPSYMAPEQAMGEKSIGPAADVYGLGAILYHLLTGKRPFHGETPAATLLQVQTKDPESPRSMDRSIHVDLETICLKCLRKNPAERYSSAEDLAFDLESWLSGNPIKARPISLGRRLFLKLNRRREWVAIVMISLLTLALGFAWWEREQKARQEYESLLEAAGSKLPDDRSAAEETLRACDFHRRDERWRQLRERCRDTPFLIPGYIFSPTLSQDGRWLAAGSTDDVRVWDLCSMQHPKTVSCQVGYMQEGALALSPDGSFLATASGSGKERALRLVTLASGDEVRLGLSANCVAFSSDGKLLATGSSQCVQVWDWAHAKLVREVASPTPCAQLCLGDEGKMIAMHSTQKHVYLWRDKGRRFERLPQRGYRIATSIVKQTLCMAIAQTVGKQPDGKLLSRLAYWDDRSNDDKVLASELNESVTCVAVSPDGRLVACALDTTVLVHEVSTERTDLRVDLGQKPISTIVLANDGTFAAVDAATSRLVVFCRRTSIDD